MNKKVIAVVIVVLLLLLGVGGFFLINKNSANTAKPETVNSQPVAEVKNNAQTMKSLRDLMMGGVSQKCTFSDDESTAKVSGTTYVSSGKVRTDFTSKTAEVTTVGHMIVDGKVSYFWMDGQPTGFKMAFDPNETTAKNNAQQSVDANKGMNFQCSGWSVDGSLYTPPASVKFSDFGAVNTPTTPGTGSPATGSQCSACNYLTGDSKTQCLTALKCN